MEKSKVLVLNFVRVLQPLIDMLIRESGCEVIIADSVEDAVKKLNEHWIRGVIISFHPEVNPDTSMGISSGLEMWRRVLRNSSEQAETIPIIVTVESGFFNTTIELQIKRYKIGNPDSLALVKKHFGLQ